MNKSNSVSAESSPAGADPKKTQSAAQSPRYSNDAVVEIRELTKRYGDFTAVHPLTLNVNRGGILGLIGHNGAGKTTAIKILVGLSKPTSGSAKIAGADCMRESRKIKRLVGYLPDRFGSYDNMRVHEYLDFFGAAYAIPRRQREQRISEVLDITASEYMRDRYVSALSHGMQQRIGIARTLLHDPEVLILDEPANGLDPKARVEMRELILHLAQLGKTVIVTSHILPELSRICDQVAIMNQGRLVAHGTLKDIMKTFTQLRWLEIQTADASTLAQTKEIIKPFASDEANISISEPESSLRFGTLTLEEGWGNMLNALVTAGIKVTQFREIQTDLEDAFLSVTREPGSENSKFAPRNKA